VDELRVGRALSRDVTFIAMRRTDDGGVEAEGIYEQDAAGNVRPSRSLAIARPLAPAAPLPRLDRVLVVRVRQAARERRPRQRRRRTSRVASGSDPPRSDDDDEDDLARGVGVAA
jgi:hypothetical protein